MKVLVSISSMVRIAFWLMLIAVVFGAVLASGSPRAAEGAGPAWSGRVPSVATGSASGTG
ncbi:hypothetical protein [Amycolatopsis aidingensis]|uniref:hypothetical protein n=1 Tax=Amycolatopsis aidingensis TaxID=2842453 RepID=UPI001C0CC8D6|nr:hypothetical protein [Amycolatopsis aidingensis]